MNGEYVIDPGLIEVRNGTFVKVGASGWQLPPIDRANYIAELLMNRLLGLSVDSTDGLSCFDNDSAGMVYILPSANSSSHWARLYDSRITFYAYANVSVYAESIFHDFQVIAERYSFIILVIPLVDTNLFYYNMKILDEMASMVGIRMFFAFFPKWYKHGDEWNYLFVDNPKHTLMIKNMQYVSNLSSCHGIGVWYGWSVRDVDITEIETFYLSLDSNLRTLYHLWLDQPYVEKAIDAGLSQLATRLDLNLVTELYSYEHLSLYGSAFESQMVVSGECFANDTQEWKRMVRDRLESILPSPVSTDHPRTLGIWIYWDANDGSNESFGVYLGNLLDNPLSERAPVNGSEIDSEFPEQSPSISDSILPSGIGVTMLAGIIIASVVAVTVIFLATKRMK